MPGPRGGPPPDGRGRGGGGRERNREGGGKSGAGGPCGGGGASFWKVLWLRGGRGGRGSSRCFPWGPSSAAARALLLRNVPPASVRLSSGSSFREGRRVGAALLLSRCRPPADYPRRTGMPLCCPFLPTPLHCKMALLRAYPAPRQKQEAGFDIKMLLSVGAGERECGAVYSHMPFHCCWNWEKLPCKVPRRLQMIPFCLLFLAFLIILRPCVIESPVCFAS